jgi:hypothetical protein
MKNPSLKAGVFHDYKTLALAHKESVIFNKTNILNCVTGWRLKPGFCFAGVPNLKVGIIS